MFGFVHGDSICLVDAPAALPSIVEFRVEGGVGKLQLYPESGLGMISL